MTLHSATEISKKVGIVVSIGLGVIFLIVIFFKLSSIVKAILFPPKISAPNEAFGPLPSIPFPHSTVHGAFTYTINTVNGSLPANFPDRVYVYQMNIPQPDLLNLQTVRDKVSNLGFVDGQGNTLPEISRGGPNYEWDNTTDIQRKIIFNIVSQNFDMSSNYLTSLDVLNANNLGDQNSAISTVQDFLSSIGLMPSDADITLTQNPSPDNTHTTSPLLYAISNGQLVPTTSLSTAQVIRVDLYQQDIDYTLTAGTDADLTHYQDFNMTMPIMYPHPPFSTMNFLVAAGPNVQEVVAAIYHHQSPNMNSQKFATYPVKTADEAFTDLKNGKGYIAAYSGNSSQILIDNVFLAYYIGDTQQDYLEPVVVFQGENGFFAYVSAVANKSLE